MVNVAGRVFVGGIVIVARGIICSAATIRIHLGKRKEKCGWTGIGLGGTWGKPLIYIVIEVALELTLALCFDRPVADNVEIQLVSHGSHGGISSDLDALTEIRVRCTLTVYLRLLLSQRH